MYYYEADDRRRKLWGIAGVVVYVALCVGIMFVSYTIALPEPELDFLVEFGTTETPTAQAAVEEAVAATVVEEVLATEDPTAPAVVEQPAPVREVNQRALFPARTENSTESSSKESPEGSATAGGSAEGGSGFSLAGRYIVGSLPRPAYNADAQGRVVVRITVDREGRVVSAVYEQAGSTTNRGELVEAARRAATRARFTPSESELQTGTITYIFRLN
ncbi:MAG: TonB family protein [Rikenellaceae bacterium]|jgi:TonB family protein|nr:TonB family protein [Rikenellaceae bacterium]